MFDEEEFISALLEQGGPALVSAVEREFRTGWEYTRALAEKREQARSQVPSARSGGADGMGRITSSVSPESYFYWLHKGRKDLGCENVWQEAEFRKDYLKDNTQAAVKYQSLNSVSGWTPAKDAAAPTVLIGTKYGMGVAA